MKLWTKLLVPVLVVGLVGVAEAKVKGEKKAGHAGVHGKVVSVSADGSIKISHGHKKKGDVQEVTVATTAATTVEIDGVAGKSVKDLRPGEHVVVTPATGAATDIKAITHKAKGAHAGKKGKNAAK